MWWTSAKTQNLRRNMTAFASIQKKKSEKEEIPLQSLITLNIWRKVLITLPGPLAGAKYA